jgi:hypothetical protein
MKIFQKHLQKFWAKHKGDPFFSLQPKIINNFKFVEIQNFEIEILGSKSKLRFQRITILHFEDQCEKSIFQKSSPSWLIFCTRDFRHEELESEGCCSRTKILC